MKNWVFAVGGVLVLLILGCFVWYLTSSFMKLSFLLKLKEKHAAAAVIIAFLIPAVITAAASFGKPVNAMAAALYLVLYLLIGSFIVFLLKKAGMIISADARVIAAVILTAVTLIIGFVLDHRVVLTKYELVTEKKVERDLRIVMFSDAHMGTTFHADKWSDYVNRINELSPDVVVIAGDLLDDSSTLSDLQGTCEAFKSLQTTDGVFYVYGNHDRGYSSGRDYTERNLIDNLENAGVRILQDETEVLDGGYVMVGREDRSARGGRMEMEELMSKTVPEQYTIVADHQPNDYKNEAAAGADLVLSGHTHGGQIIPFDLLVRLSNDRIYGRENRGKTQFIVSSGISNWAMDYKTGTKSEIVLIDVKKAE